MTITMLGFWALVAWVITSLVRGVGDGRRSEADAILAERFARGEIEEEEYRRRRDLIRATR
ncbi:MAG: SHOCT domain-containing protein [Acidimicrobiia bacterium]